MSDFLATKECRCCRRTLPASAFRPNPKLRDGLHSWCRGCSREAVRSSRAIHGSRYNDQRRGKLRGKSGVIAAIADDPVCEGYLAVAALDPCAYCGAESTELDHIEPTARGGESAWDNLVGCCRKCNSTKNRWSLLGFLLRRRLIGERDALVEELRAVA